MRVCTIEMCLSAPRRGLRMRSQGEMISAVVAVCVGRIRTHEADRHVHIRIRNTDRDWLMIAAKQTLARACTQGAIQDLKRR